MRILILTLLTAVLITGAEPAAEKAKPVAAPTIGAWTVSVFIPKPPEAGKPLDVDLTLTPAATKPKAVRLWVGAADAKGSVKVKAEPEAPGAYCVGVEVPDPISTESKLWIAVEAEDGQVAKGAVDLPRK